MGSRMRLRDIQTLLSIHEETLRPSTVGESALDNNAAVRFVRLDEYRHAVKALAVVPALTRFAQAVVDQPLVRDIRDEVTVPLGVAKPFLDAMNMLANAASLLKLLLDSTVESETETSIAIELPDTTDLRDLHTLVGEVAEFVAGFTGLPVGDGDDRVDAIELRGFDVGSSWLAMKAASVPIVRLIGLVFRAVVSLRDWMATKDAETKLLAASAEDTQSAVALTKKLRLKLARELAGSVAKEGASKSTPEELNRIAALIASGERLVERRVRLLPSRKAPTDVRRAFPPKPVDRTDTMMTVGGTNRVRGERRDRDSREPEQDHASGSESGGLLLRARILGVRAVPGDQCRSSPTHREGRHHIPELRRAVRRETVGAVDPAFGSALLLHRHEMHRATFNVRRVDDVDDVTGYARRQAGRP